MKTSLRMRDRKRGPLSANCLQLLQILNGEIFVRSVFWFT